MSVVSTPVESWLRLHHALPAEFRAILQLLADRPLDPKTRFAGMARQSVFEHNGYVVEARLRVVSRAGAPPGFDCTAAAIAEGDGPLPGGSTGPGPADVSFAVDLVIDEIARLQVLAATPGPESRRMYPWVRALQRLTGWDDDEIRKRVARAVVAQVHRGETSPATSTKGGAP